MFLHPKGSKVSCIKILLFRCCDVTLSLPNWPLPVLSSLSRNRKFPWCSSPSNPSFNISLSFFFFFSSVMKLPTLFWILISVKLIWPFPPKPQALLFLLPFSFSFLLSFYSSISLSLFLFPPVVTHSSPLHTPSLFPGFGCDGSGQAEGGSVREEETGVSQGEEIGIVEQRARAPERGHLHPDPSPGRGSGDGQAGQGSYDHWARAH